MERQITEETWSRKTRTRDLGLYYTDDNKDEKDCLVEANCYTS